MINFKMTKISNDACINLIIRVSVLGLLYGIICYILSSKYPKKKKKPHYPVFQFLKKFTIMLQYHSKFMMVLW